MQNTVEKWFEKACLMSIGYAYKHPEKSTSEQLYPALIGLGSGYSPFKLEEGSFSFHSYYKWEPGRETKTSFIKSVTSLFEEQLLVYISTIERAAQAEKKAFAYLPRGLSDHDILDDAKRLVYYQILEQSFQTIAEALPKHAEEGGVTYQTVNRGVSRFAAFVGVPIRPSKKGGRPKTK